MLPLPLNEFIALQHPDTTPSSEHAYREWLTVGGFPGVASLVDATAIHQANSSLFDSIFTRDISLRGQFRDTEAFKTSIETVNRYLTLMQDAHLIYRCREYDTRGKSWLKTYGNFYFVDPGIRNAHDSENMVFLELKRRG